MTPEGRDDVGSPNRILREEVDGKVIIRTGRRIPGVTPLAGVHHPISVVRMAVEDAYGARQWREGEDGAPDEVALRTERLKEEMDAAAARHPEVDYEPVLIDATYAGLIGGADAPLVIPALDRDGDCLSDLVLPMFGSIAGAESVLLGFDENLETDVAMAEAPHGTAPALLGKDLANPMAMLLSCAAVLHHAAQRGHLEAEAASRAIYESTLEAVAAGVRTPALAAMPPPASASRTSWKRVRTKRSTGARWAPQADAAGEHARELAGAARPSGRPRSLGERMFPAIERPWRERAARTAGLVRAFVLLEDPGLDVVSRSQAGQHGQEPPPPSCAQGGWRTRPSRRGGRSRAWSEEPAASYSPRPFRAKYHRR